MSCIWECRTSASVTAFCEGVLRRPALAEDPRFLSNASRVEHRPALDAEIEQVFGRLTTPAILERLETARIASARLRTVQQLADHPQLRARRRWHEVDTPAGPSGRWRRRRRSIMSRRSWGPYPGSEPTPAPSWMSWGSMQGPSPDGGTRGWCE